MTISITRLYDLLTIKVGKDTAETLTTYIEGKIKEEFIDNSKILATKEDIALLKERAANDKVEIIKWMFIFWIGQVAVTFGFILLFLKK
jgi:hypothetical protein